MMARILIVEYHKTHLSVVVEKLVSKCVPPLSVILILDAAIAEDEQPPIHLV